MKNKPQTTKKLPVSEERLEWLLQHPLQMNIGEFVIVVRLAMERLKEITPKGNKS